ncbi:MAG TPA: phytanoyl-CoA dioxygenase family protein [Povalibacter sp.]|nr:phytanoyl-CoA dioxygenase family protein [Povalibacter sp.]
MTRSATPVLSPWQLHDFADEGFLVLPQICSAIEVAWLHAALIELFRRRAGRTEGRQFDMLGLDTDADQPRQPQILEPSVLVPELLRTAYFQRVATAARQLLGRDAQFSFDHAILKPAGSAAATPWHQDEIHQTQRYLRHRQVSFWLALQHTSMLNGCMRYVPRSNHWPLLPHQPLNGDARLHALECVPGSFDESLAVEVPVHAGSCIAHGSRTLHAALPNFSAQDRIAYILAFIGPPLPGRRQRVAITAGETANRRRHQRWLLRGGFLVAIARRLARFGNIQPRLVWLKLRTLVRATVGLTEE